MRRFAAANDIETRRRDGTGQNIVSGEPTVMRGSRTLPQAVRAVILAAAAAGLLSAQRAGLSDAVRAFIRVDAPVVALTHVRVIDGTGAAPRTDQTILIRDGNIAEVADASSARVPDGATVLDLTGKSVIPGIVMV